MEHTIITGARGGQYWLDENNVKHYISQQGPVAKPKKNVNHLPSPAEQKKVKRVGRYEVVELTSPPNTYIGYFSEWKHGERVDDFKEWCHAYNKQEAVDEFRDRYWRAIQNGNITLDEVIVER